MTLVLRSLNPFAHLRWSAALVQAAFALTVSIPLHSSPCVAETLKDVVRSTTLRRIEIATDGAKTRRNSRGGESMSWFNGMDPQSNFALLWGDKNGANLAFSWIGAHIEGLRLANPFAKRYPEMVDAHATFLNSARVPIRLRILIPHPTYRMMVQYHTLQQFNEVEPPSLKVVASEELEFNGQKAMYYRSERGGCSLVFKLAQLSVVTLSTLKCEHSPRLMEIAKELDFARFNEKLNS